MSSLGQNNQLEWATNNRHKSPLHRRLDADPRKKLTGNVRIPTNVLKEALLLLQNESPLPIPALQKQAQKGVENRNKHSPDHVAAGSMLK